MKDDLKSGVPQDWLVVGWFTPDYRPLAEKFAANLKEYQTPFHLFAMPKLGGGWDTSRKPSVVLQAMTIYPGRTLVLMDVDCLVRGDIRPATDIPGDVGITVIARDVTKHGKVKHWLAVECSSRVVVFKPTEGARAFARRWEAEIESGRFNHDEHSMAWTFLKSFDVRFSYLPQAYSGRELAMLPDAVILHESAHDKDRKAAKNSGVRGMLRRIERPFRSGKTKAAKLNGELSTMLGDSHSA